MSYSLDSSYCYCSGEDSFSYISDPCYCSIHSCTLHQSYQSYCSVQYPPSGSCTLHQPYPYYYQGGIPQQQVSSPIYSSSSVFQVRPEKSRRFSSEQIRILEEHFYKIDKYVSKTTIDDLSTRTQLKPAQIRVWFNNKRSREHR